MQPRICDFAALRFCGKSCFQHLAQNVGHLNAFTGALALDPPVQVGRNVDGEAFHPHRLGGLLLRRDADIAKQKRKKQAKIAVP